MVMTTLKKRLSMAVRGHSLLKDKRDELMKRFIELAKENKALRDRVEEMVSGAYAGFRAANAVMSNEVLEESLMYPKQSVNLEVEYENIMSVVVPSFGFSYGNSDDSDIYPYGFANTSGELDAATKSISEVFPLLLELAAVEKKTALLAGEIEKTRRRVNALEYVMIPNLQETIKYIRMKLEENERGNQVRLMKLKDMMLNEAMLEKQAATSEALKEYASK
jgi:V/A-type H+-transporting ATPase subunit D